VTEVEQAAIKAYSDVVMRALELEVAGRMTGREVHDLFPGLFGHLHPGRDCDCK